MIPEKSTLINCAFIISIILPTLINANFSIRPSVFICNAKPKGTATNNTTRGAGMLFTILFFIKLKMIKIAKHAKPISVKWVFSWAILSGIIASSSKGSFPFNKAGLMPNKLCTCLDIMIMPIAASIPCMAAPGKKSLNFPSFSTPNNIWITPATTIAPNARCQPTVLSVPPKEATAPEAITINPAAGPLIVNKEPAKKLTTIPPIIAVTRPYMAGNSDALAIPKLKGNAKRKTKKPESASVFQYSFNPAIPSFGTIFLVDMILDFNLLIHLSLF